MIPYTVVVLIGSLTLWVLVEIIAHEYRAMKRRRSAAIVARVIGLRGDTD